MAFNVINMKHREAKEAWLHINGADGEPMYADDKKKKPVRIKFKSPHSKAFRDAHLLLSAKISQLTNGKKKEYEELAKQNAKLDAEKIQNDVLESFIRSEDLSVDFVVEMAIDWEGFYDENGKELEFAPEYLQWLLCQMENYNVLHQIRNSFKDTEAFILA